ncbi:hypothetical protein B0T26DRAFT_757479 [Lasiosphaeria miniovina]|uniref:Uncharacterized protein n=1 Tax=Lasiosphaeria miniovina TaxID=1954250 RepID=A0AA39ZUI8_9PEZI|nr:uncharacterized protein B0T26DRAFT_757479 [Lasiosphaeria miniovina]KAK0703981.1 hypothetical protein B0T26DRAFT_757479 [Lasiosphaeria miniovina]
MAPSDLKFDFVTLDVFTDTRYVGNPLAVVFIPAALRGQLTQEKKQAIASEFNLSETVFFHQPDNELDTPVTTREIDIFTTTQELPFAGHPTIGSAYLVLDHFGWGHVNTLLTKAGPIPIEAGSLGVGVGAGVGAGAGRGVRAAIPSAVHIHQHTLSSLLGSGAVPADIQGSVDSALSDDAEIRAAELAAPTVSIVRGMTFLLVRLPSLAHLGRISIAKQLNFARVPGLQDAGEWRGGFVSRYYYVVTGESTAAGGAREWAIRTRLNVEQGFEDPATGSAACTLASYLAISTRAVHGASFALTQGVEMGRRSEIAVDVTAEADGGNAGEVRVKNVFLGGTAVLVMSGSIYA